jgi:hypothetical protein
MLAESYGGVAYVLVSSSLSINNCNLTSNDAVFGGGGLLVESSTLNFTSSIMNNHQSKNGGAVYGVASVLTLSYSNFAANGGKSYEGGAFYLTSTSLLTTTRCNFTQNQVR